MALHRHVPIIAVMAWLCAPTAAADHPNILVLLTDDQTYRSIGAINNPEVKTPNLDRLAARGVVMTHCFNQGSWSGAVCVPSRAMLNSGRHVFRIVEPRDDRRAGRLEIDGPLWAEHFRDHGYRTFATGKWHNGKASFHRSFSHGTSIFFGGMHQVRKGGHFKPWVQDHDPEGVYDRARQVEHYTTDLFADAAIGFLREHGREPEPFFMYVAFSAPHDPREAPDERLALYDASTVELPPNFLPEHPFDQGDHRLRDEMLLPFPRTEDAVRCERAIYYAMITHIDARVGDILGALDEIGHTDDTIVVFTSDHGLAVGQHGLLGKQNQYDHSVRVPMIIAGPGIPRGETRDELVYLHQLYATTCGLAGLPVPEHVQAPSLAAIIRDGAREGGYDSVFGAYRDFQRMVRTDRYKLTRYPHNGEVQLFDLNRDPWEREDLSGDPDYQEILAGLDRRLRRWQEVAGDG